MEGPRLAAAREMKPKIFIQTNQKQWLGAVVARQAILRAARDPSSFDVQILEAKDYSCLEERIGQPYQSNGKPRVWQDDLQSFTPLRFDPPAKMDYQGRALVIDPDVFAVTDVRPLLDLDMEGHAILCRNLSGDEARRRKRASSVMLLDCAKLSHWRMEEMFSELFDGSRDYKQWMELETEPADSIGPLEPEWNDFDHLDANTRMLHNTRRETQPWKTGLPIDFDDGKRFSPWSPKGIARRLRPKRYQPHPDPSQEQLFFALLRECLESGVVTEATVREEMKQNHLRHDALKLADRSAGFPR